jgi:DNA end-binding protein Ku
MSVLRYKDYQGGVEFDKGSLIVRVLHIDDLITTEIDNASEAQAAFVELVDDYIASCVALGKQPCKPFKGSFNIRISSNLHKKAAFAAIEEGETLNSFVESAIEAKLLSGQNEIVGTDVAVTTNPRVNWNGFLRLSLVTCPITLIPTTTESENAWIEQVSNRVASRYAGDESRAFVVEIDQFVARQEIDYLYLANSFYIVPERNSVDAYAVIRETIRSLDKVAIARVVSSSREHVFALQARGSGLLGTQVRHPNEVQKPSKYFDAIRNVKVTRDMLDLAKHIVEAKSGHFDPEEFWDHYESDPGNPLNQEHSPSKTGGNVISLMDALRASAKRGGTPIQPQKITKETSSRKPAGKR